MIKVVAFDLDGTLTQHKSGLDDQNRSFLEKLSNRYKLLIVGAGTCRRIFNQLDSFPVDIIGNYGMQYANYNAREKDIDIIRDEVFPVDRDTIEKKVTLLREKHGFNDFTGDNVEYHPSGCITFPILGTKAKQEDKLAFDPDRTKRRKIYDDVVNTFSDYIVFIGGSSSFDMAPKPYNKAYALDLYCRENSINHNEVIYVGDDYGPGGNDESVFKSDYNAIEIDDYRTLSQKLDFLIK